MVHRLIILKKINPSFLFLFSFRRVQSSPINYDFIPLFSFIPYAIFFFSFFFSFSFFVSFFFFNIFIFIIITEVGMFLDLLIGRKENYVRTRGGGRASSLERSSHEVVTDTDSSPLFLFFFYFFLFAFSFFSSFSVFLFARFFLP